MKALDSMIIPTTFSKPGDYYTHQRSDLLSLVQEPIGHVLDVGCGAGGNAALLRQLGAMSLAGIEIDRQAAEAARATFDKVYASPVEKVLPHFPAGEYDTIICADVLEHLRDPWQVLRELRHCATPQAQLLASIPNIRNYRTFLNLALRGTVGYQQEGLMDVTHLRFFTKRDFLTSLLEAGWQPVALGHNPYGPAARLAKLLRRTSLSEFLVIQWHVRAWPV